MNNFKVKDFLKRNLFWIIIIGYFALLDYKNHKDDLIMENSGVVISVTVVNHSRISRDRGGATKNVSSGNYYINNIRYNCFSEKILPIGTKFKIKYNPENPKMWRSVDE